MDTPDIRQLNAQVAHRWWARLRTARWLWITIAMFCATRVGIAITAYIAAMLVVNPLDPPRPPFRPENLLANIFGSHWDASHYLGVALNGYQYPTNPYGVPFFPLLPLLMRAGSYIVGDALTAGLIVTNGALLLGSLLLWRLVELEWNSAIAERSVWYLLIFPTSLFGSAVYGESLMLFGAVAALFCARTNRWGGAALAGCVAALSRPVGVLVAPMLVVEWWAQRQQSPPARRPSWSALLAPAVAVMGLGTYMCYLQLTYGDALLFVHAQAEWGRQHSMLTLLNDLVARPTPGWRAALLAGQVPLDAWIDGGLTLTFGVLGVILLAQRRWSESCFVLLSVYVELNAGAWMAQRRHVWVLFPALVLLARWGERSWIDRLLTSLFLLGLGLFTTMFANWYWVA